MNDPQIAAFAVIAALLTMTPGADTMLVIRNVMSRGRRAGLQTTVGACCGLFVHSTLSALGLSLILVRSATAFEVVKMVGAGYLVWLGIQGLRQAMRYDVARDTLGGAPEMPVMASGRRSFLEGFLNNVLNPKVAVFYLAFLPQFMHPDDWVFGKSMFLAAIHFVEGLVWMSTLTLFIARVRTWITRPRVRRTIEATAGVVLIGFGARLALERTR
jgi:RhtB (resistance to homoserine/threonine) family protein